MSPNRPDARLGRTLRVWPGIVALVLLLVAWFGPALVPQAGAYAMLVAAVCALGVILWWLFLSRAPWKERIGALLLIVAGLAVTYRFVHESIAGGMMGMMLPLYSLPVMGFALVAGAVIARRFSTAARRATIAASILLGCLTFTLIRTEGVRGSGSDLRWRWTPTPEERLLAGMGDIALAEVSTPDERPAPSEAAAAVPNNDTSSALPESATVPRTAAPRPHDGDQEARAASAVAPQRSPVRATDVNPSAAWPGFRGPGRDGVVRNARIQTDWARQPPVEVWRRPVGPGWSSFAVSGGLVYTQEQRGGQELVSCYRLASGEPVWFHADPVRFWESNAGAGPRATPSVQDGRVYTLGATGIVNALDAATGRRIWSRNAAEDAGKDVPGWGFASSPLVVGDVVIVSAAGRLVAYDAATGAPRWMGEPGGSGYSSPHLTTIGSVPQVLQLRGGRMVSVAPGDGTLLWQHEWSGESILQPALAGDGDVLIAGGDMMGGTGIRRLAVAKGPSGWTVEERWTTRGLKPYFNDFVVHEGYAYGFDGSILAAIDLADGTRKWKGGRYGQGQLVVLAAQDVLLVLSEDGELALVRAAPDRFTELARIPALDGKTWNHPVLVDDILLVRNGQEMAAFRLTRAAP